MDEKRIYHAPGACNDGWRCGIMEVEVLRTYTWDEYYDKFYDWAESTQVRNLYGLTSLGPADEVAEIIIELQGNIAASNRLLKKAVAAKLAFSGSDLMDFAYANDKEALTAAARNSAGRLTAEDMEDLYGEIDDETIIEICKQQNLVLPEYLCEEEDEEDCEYNEYDESEYYEYYESEETEDEELWGEGDLYMEEESRPPKKRGLFATLFGVAAGINLAKGFNKHRRNDRCDGDCAHCPPHYGYRYGRWYYGHDHDHGCEFGGNKGSGSMD